MSEAAVEHNSLLHSLFKASELTFVPKECANKAQQINY